MDKRYLEMCQEIDDDAKGLTGWEIDFIDAMLKKNGPTTQKEADKITQIYQQRILDGGIEDGDGWDGDEGD
jgi:hypothetical protein